MEGSTVAAEVAAAFRRGGLDRLFQLTGGDQPLWIALRDAGIRMVVARSEAGAVYMADGYARASGKVAATYGQAGPGAANVAASLADAYWAQSPVFALTGATSTDALQANEYQDLNQAALFVPVTKWTGAVGEPQQAGSLVSKAIQLAAMGPSGPTHLDIPKNFFARAANPVARELAQQPVARTQVQPADISELLGALKKSKKPLILVGEGVRFAAAWDDVENLSAATGAPIVTTMGGKPAILGSHPNLCGVVGRYSSVVANQILGEADFVLALGTRLGGLATNGYSLPRPNAHLVQVDIDATSVANRHRPNQAIIADLRDLLPALDKAVHDEKLRAPAEWLDQCREKARSWNGVLRKRTETAEAAKKLSPLSVIDAISRYASEIAVVADTGYMAAWTGVLYPIQKHNSYFRAVGSLGWALPASIGVQMARREKVICITGDGGAGYNLTDIETAVRYKCPVVFIVLDNGGLIFEYHEQKYRWKGNVVAEANDFGPTDFAAIARGLGAESWKADSKESLESALKKAMAAQGPTLIHAIIDREAFPPVTNFDAVMARDL